MNEHPKKRDLDGIYFLIEPDACEVTTVSVHDLLSDDDREALAWVREHGGVNALSIGFQDADNRRIELCSSLGIDLETGWADAMVAMRRRLMPEGMEWPTVDGEPVVIGERMRSCGIEDCKVVGIDPANARLFLAFNDIEKGKAVYFPDLAKDCHRSAPKVLDADGVEIGIGDKLYDTDTGCARIVRAINANGTVEFEGYEDRGWFTMFLTHRAPVLAADGEPLEVGQTVWGIGNGVEFTVIGLPNPGEYQAVKLQLDDGAFTGLDPNLLTHQRPVLDAEGVPIHEGDTVYGAVFGGPFTVTEVSDKGSVFVDVFPDTGMHGFMFTHTRPEPPDTWERIEEDARKDRCSYFGVKYQDCGRCTQLATSCSISKARDLVRRCRALAERSER